jgi:hypothetical protein
VGGIPEKPSSESEIPDRWRISVADGQVFSLQRRSIGVRDDVGIGGNRHPGTSPRLPHTRELSP